MSDLIIIKSFFNFTAAFPCRNFYCFTTTWILNIFFVLIFGACADVKHVIACGILIFCESRNKFYRASKQWSFINYLNYIKFFHDILLILRDHFPASNKG
jgi:hypothetical protein